MRAFPCLLLLTAGCGFPELAEAPEQRTGPPPALAPLEPLLQQDLQSDSAGDAELEARGADLRARAAAIHVDPQANVDLARRADALRQRAAGLAADPIEPETREAMETIGEP